MPASAPRRFTPGSTFQHLAKAYDAAHPRAHLKTGGPEIEHTAFSFFRQVDVCALKSVLVLDKGEEFSFQCG
jgi:hypothetical protein